MKLINRRVRVKREITRFTSFLCGGIVLLLGIEFLIAWLSGADRIIMLFPYGELLLEAVLFIGLGIVSLLGILKKGI